MTAAAWVSALVVLDLQQGGIFAGKDCRGKPVWIPPIREPCRQPNPADVPRAVPVGEESVIERMLPGQARLVWLITHRFANNDGYGPLAVARVLPGGIAVESLGRLRGRTDRISFELWRVRQERVVVATAASCTSAEQVEDCPRATSLLIDHAGHLIQPPLTLTDGRCVGEPHFELKQSDEARLPSGELRRYAMTTTLGHDARYIVVNEQIVVSEMDPAGQGQMREIQRVDADRFIHVDRGRFFTRQLPLWPRMVPLPSDAR